MAHMNTIAAKLIDELKLAMKAKDTLALNALRALKAALTNASIAKGSLSTPLDEAETQAVVRKQIKQREDAAEQYRKAGRADLLETEESEIKILSPFLPPALTEEEILSLLDAVIAETGATSKKDMGSVMKLMQERTAGCAPGKLLAQLISKKLN